MTDKTKKLIGWLIVAVAIVVAAYLGVVYPIPEPPDIQVMGEGDTNLTNLVLDRPAGDGSANYLYLDAARLAFDADANTHMEADTGDQIDIAVGGSDDFQITANAFTALSGSALEANTINETTAASGVTVDSVVLKDGGATLTSNFIVSARTAISVTNGAVFTPTGTYQPIESAAEVTPTISTSGYTTGTLLVLIDTSDTTINLADSGTLMLSAAGALGQYDSLTLWFDGTNWIEVSRSDN